jgi:hypothetical protein
MYKYKHSTFPGRNRDNYLLYLKGFGLHGFIFEETLRQPSNTMTVVATPHPA